MKKLLVITAILSVFLAACTFPTAEKTPSPKEIAQTMVAQTESAQAQVENTPLPTNTPAPTPENTATVVAASSVPLISVSVATNCRTGPKIAYSLVLVFQPGATAEVVGKYSQDNYWIIKTPTNETCWLWGEYASIDGNTDILPEIASPAPPIVEEVPTKEGGSGATATATPTLAIIVVGPPAPTNFQASASCQILEMNGQKIIQGKTDTITWASSNGATGYKVYVNGVEEKNLNANATGTHFDAIAMKSSEYGVAAYNDLGSSTIVTIPAPSCP